MCRQHPFLKLQGVQHHSAAVREKQDQIFGLLTRHLPRAPYPPWWQRAPTRPARAQSTSSVADHASTASSHPSSQLGPGLVSYRNEYTGDQ